MESAPDLTVISISEAANLLSVSDDTIGRMVNRGLLLSVKIGRRRLIRLASVEQVLADGVRRIA